MANKRAFKEVCAELEAAGSSTAFNIGLMKLMTQTAWAAGLFEGEGCFSPFKSKHLPRKSDGGVSYCVYPHAQITMCDLDVLQRFQSIMGVGRINGPYESSKKDGSYRKPIYRWWTINKTAIKVIDRLLPFMCSRRQQQISEALKQCGRFDTRKAA